MELDSQRPVKRIQIRPALAQLGPDMGLACPYHIPSMVSWPGKASNRSKNYRLNSFGKGSESILKDVCQSAKMFDVKEKLCLSQTSGFINPGISHNRGILSLNKDISSFILLEQTFWSQVWFISLRGVKIQHHFKIHLMWMLEKIAPHTKSNAIGRLWSLGQPSSTANNCPNRMICGSSFFLQNLKPRWVPRNPGFT